MRFEFGKNWKKYAAALDEKRIDAAEASFDEMLGAGAVHDKSFLDAGCGSGLFSLSAARLGARKIYSFDFDKNSVETTKSVKEMFVHGTADWTIERGDILDDDFLRSIGKYDIVYSWGVLHHTGAMWKAIENISSNVSENGILFISIYNDQGRTSSIWRLIKRAYNILPGIAKWLILYPVFIRLWLPAFLRDFIRLKPFSTWKSYTKNRGMSPWRDVVDWVGGYPFEVASISAVTEFLKQKGFSLIKLKPCHGSGTNEFVFENAQ